MASVSQYSMRRYPIGAPDSQPAIGSSAYYVTANQKVTVLPEKCNKKTWGQRLKITKTNEKLLNEANEAEFNLIHSKHVPSSLSKSMKYAEQNLYGTMRGIPAGSVRGGNIFGHFPHEVAVVVCSCAEYLNGTKRELKKASICKKCRGSRLPLAPIGGTVRIHSSPSIVQITRNSAGTLRLPFISSTSKKPSRPSILDANDPYDLVRRSRLVSPELKSIKNNASKELIRKRAKSISPSRSRSRNRRVRTPSPNENSKNQVNRSRSANRIKAAQQQQQHQQKSTDGQECWLEKFDPLDPGGRRSILQYDINPYELISKNNNSSSEFTPVNDDNMDYDLALHSRKYENILNLVYNKNQAPPPPTSSTSINQSNAAKNPTTSSTTTTTIAATKNQKTKRSHIKDKKNEVIYEHVNVNVNIDQQPKLQHSNSLPNGDTINNENISVYSIGTTDIGIKSILKRPTSVSFPIHHDKLVNSSGINEINQNDKKINDDTSQHIIKATNLDKTNNLTTTTTNLNNIHNNKKQNFDREKSQNSGSHFYLPLPPRKKVQFVVENDVIINENHSSTEVTIIANNNNNNNNNNSTATTTASVTNSNDAVNNFNSYMENNNENNNDADVDDDYDDDKQFEKLNNHFDEYEKIIIRNCDDVYQDCSTVETEEHHVEEKPINTDIVESRGTSTVIFPRQSYLRRSFSERRNNSNIKNDVSFLDTMALRQKNYNNRRDSRTIFSTEYPHHQREPIAPSEPNPDYSENEKSSSSTSDSSSSYTYDDDNIYEDYSTSINVIVNNLKSNSSKSRIFGPVSANKTVVNVSPNLVINKESPAVHRLEIKHNDNDDNAAQKKTSILISGNECYSTVNINDNTQIYQSSVVVNDDVSNLSGILKSSTNTITISVGSSNSAEEALIEKINNLLNNGIKSVIPVNGNETTNHQNNINVNYNNNYNIQNDSPNNRGSTLITLDYSDAHTENEDDIVNQDDLEEDERNLKKLLRNPVEAIRFNLVPHVCGKKIDDVVDNKTSQKMKNILKDHSLLNSGDCNSFITKLLEDPTLEHVADGLDNELVAKLLEKSLIRLKESRTNDCKSGTKDENNDMTNLINLSLDKVKEERLKFDDKAKPVEKGKSKSVLKRGNDNNKDKEKVNDKDNNKDIDKDNDKDRDKEKDKDKDTQSNRDSVSSGNSYSSAIYERYDFENPGDLSDCYQSCSSELTAEEDGSNTRSQFYQMLVDATLSEIEISTNNDDDHLYESIRLNGDPIYEEISEIPPPLPLTAPPDIDLEKKNSRSIFEGASKYDILSYLVDAKERGIVPEESYAYNFSNSSDIIMEEETGDPKAAVELHERQNSDVSSRISQITNVSDSSIDESSLINNKNNLHRKSSIEIERNDSGVGSETSKSSRSRFQLSPSFLAADKKCPIHLCEDCDGTVETQISESVMYAPLVCRKCAKKRAERKEIITEIVETEEKYGRDLQIILEEFYQPMLVAGLLTQDQLSAIFLNTEELLENNQALSERMRDALDIATEHGDDDLLTVNIGRLFLDASPMLHAFESYCVRQAASSLLLANLEKEKELLRIFLRVSQMENTVLRRMNLNSFLMVPVQRVTKYPLLLARLYKVTPTHCEGRESLKQAQEKIELHLNHMNREAKDVPLKLWRRISSSSPNRRASCEMDMIKIKLRKMAVDILEWNHDEVRFAAEGRLLFTQPTDNNWRKGRTIKLTPTNALLVTNGKPSPNYKADRAQNEILNFPRHTGIREASLLLVREKAGRYTLLREPLYLDRCIVCTEADWDDYFEVQEISSKDTFIFKAEDGARTKYWYTQLQYHSQGMGAWRKRRSALANIMINGMMTRQ